MLNEDSYLTHLLTNLAQTLIILVSLFGIVGFFAYLLLGTIGLYLCAVLIVGIAFFGGSKANGELLLRTYRALPLSPYQAPNLYRLTQYLAINAGLDSIPTLFYLPDSNSMNAFATSTSKGAAIAISYSLIKNVNEREMLGVIAHELAHIANGDLKIMALAQSANRILLFLSNFFQLMVLISFPFILLGVIIIDPLILFLVMFAPFLAIYLQLSLSRIREYHADLIAVKIAGDSHGLISALKKIGYFEKYKIGFIFYPYGDIDRTPDWLKTHPPIAKRIQKILSLSSQYQLPFQEFGEPPSWVEEDFWNHPRIIRVRRSPWWL